MATSWGRSGAARRRFCSCFFSCQNRQKSCCFWQKNMSFWVVPTKDWDLNSDACVFSWIFVVHLLILRVRTGLEEAKNSMSSNWMIVAKSVRSSGLANLKVSMGCSAFPFRLELGFFWPLYLSKIFSVISVLILCFRFAMSWIISLWFRNRLDNGERGTNRSIRLLVRHWWACRKNNIGHLLAVKLGLLKSTFLTGD